MEQMSLYTVWLASVRGQQFAQQIQQQNPELIEQLRNHIRSRSFSGSAEEHSWSTRVYLQPNPSSPYIPHDCTCIINMPYFCFSLTFFPQGRATIWRDYNLYTHFLTSNPRHSWNEETRMGSNGTLLWKKLWSGEMRAWSLDHERKHPTHLGQNILQTPNHKKSQEVIQPAERTWVNSVFRASTFCRDRVLYVLNTLPSSCYEFRVLLSSHDEWRVREECTFTALQGAFRLFLIQ